MKISKENLSIIFLLILFSIPSAYSLLHQGFFETDDGEWMIIRFASFHQALRDGQFPVRFLGSLNHGYGYPVANFLYPGFMYMGEFVHVFGFGFVNTIKILLGFSLAGSVICSYLWLSKIFPKVGSFVGALVYLYTPYHLFDVYKRGSVGEVLSLGIVPFIFWQIERESFFWTCLGISMLIVSHNTLAVVFLPIIFLYALLQKKSILISFILGISLSSFFWIPALYDLQFTVFSKTKVSEWWNYFADYKLFGATTLLILSITLFLFIAIKQFRRSKLLIFFIITELIGLIFSSSISKILWQVLPVGFVQFPFRFLSITVLSSSFLSTFFLSHPPKKNMIILSFIVIFSLFVFSSSFLIPVRFFDKGEGFYSTNQDTTTVKNEYMPVWVKQIPTQRWKQKVELEEGLLIEHSIKSNNISFSTFSNKKQTVRINTVYFPGWKVFVDGTEVSIDYKNNFGVISFNLPSGNHKVLATFTETMVRAISDLISILSILVVLMFTFQKKLHLLK